LPLKMGDQIIGVLDILSTDEDDFNADDVSVLQNVANQITIALENARTYATEREAAKRLRELDRSKRRFLANMSHELRTPLTNIIGFSRLMLKGIGGQLPERLRSDTQIIYHNGQHLLGLINDLLDISHIEAGLMELEFKEVDLAELINSVMATASALVRDKEIELHQEIAPDLPTVQADAARIRQVLLRLLTNAAKFTERGAITIRSWASDGEVLVSVSDTGVGIPPEDHERIFQQFEQGSLENGRRPNGAGLGLALSKEFLEMHGGQIRLESKLGQGSTFTLSLPMSQSTETIKDK
jgi:signal transduction histidine kinase